MVFGSRPRRGIVAATISVALLAQIQIEGFRWQMIPLYLVAVGLAAGDVFFLERRLEWSSRLVRGILGTVGLMLAAFLPVVLPVSEIPAPSVPAGIRTMTVDLIDRSRDEPYGERPGGPRELTAQVWYPATPDQGGERAVWSLDWEVVAPQALGMTAIWCDAHRQGLPVGSDIVPDRIIHGLSDLLDELDG